MEENFSVFETVNNSLKKVILFAILLILFSISYVGKQAVHFITPLSQEKVSVMSQVRTLLEQKENTYSLIQSRSLLPAAHAGAPYDNAAAYALIDYDSGEVLSEKDLSKKVSIASITKVMTAVTALDLASPDEVFTTTEKASRAIPTKLALIPGEKFTLRELLHAALLTSANDTTEVIRDGINAKYGEEVFIEAMNVKAKYIGLKNSHFQNPQGFDARNHYSTAEDLAILTHYALTHYPLITEIVKKNAEYLPENGNHRYFVLYNWNGLIDVYPNVYGMKIGNTGDAGTTTVVVSERNGKKMISVVLGASDVLERDLWASQLLDLGYEMTLGLTPVNVTEQQLRDKYATWVAWN